MGGKSKADQKGKEKKDAPTWLEKKAMVDREEDAIEEEIREQEEWIAMMKEMDNEGLKNYLSNRPDHLKAKNLEKCEPSKRVRREKEEEMVKVLQRPTTYWAQFGRFKETENKLLAIILLSILVIIFIKYVMLKYVAEEPEL